MNMHLVLATDTFWTNPDPPKATCVCCLQKLLVRHRGGRLGVGEELGGASGCQVHAPWVAFHALGEPF